jgi:hypothetical protein
LRRGGLALLFVTGVLVLALGFVAFVPPLRTVRQAEWPAVALVPPAQNAWQSYLGALFDLTREPLPGWIVTATDLPAFTADQLAYLDRHPAALRSLHEGTQRPQSRYFSQATTASTPLPHPRAVRGLAQLATAQAHRFRLEGRAEDAWPLELDAYLYGGDVAEPDTGVLPALMSIGCRRTASTGLFRALAHPSLAPASALAIARGVARADARMPLPYAVAAAEWNLMGRTIESYYLNNQMPGARRQPAERPGWRAQALRLRVLDSFFRQHRALLETARGPLETWDFEALARFDGARRPAPAWWRWPFFIEQAAGEMITRVSPSIGQPARLLYVDRANGCALQALASLRAYRAAHRAWPEDLASAMAVTGLPVPRDPLTGQEVRYRLDPAGPVLWLRGFDRGDDGGLRDYDDRLQMRILPGTDVVYRLGEVPVLLRP